MRQAIPTLVFLALCAALTAASEAPSLGKKPPGVRPEKKYVAYKITRGDRLSVAVLGEPELRGAGFRVEAIGTINLPYIQDIRLVGLTIAEAQDAIAKAYREGRFLRNPQVTVTVDEYAPRTVIISGKVNIQGRQEIPPDTEFTIKDLIAKAGGFGDTARGTAVRVTRTMPDGSLKTYTLDVESAIKGRDNSTAKDAAFVLEPDDIIYVPEKII